MEFVTRLEILLPNSDAFIKMIAKILMPTRVTPRMDNEEFFSWRVVRKINDCHNADADKGYP